MRYKNNGDGGRSWELTARWRGQWLTNILLTRFQGGKKQSYLPGVGSLRTRTVDAMSRQRREGWTPNVAPFRTTRLAACTHLLAECYAIQAFSIASDFDPQLMPKIQKPDHDEKSLHRHTIPCFRVVQITILATARITRKHHTLLTLIREEERLSTT